MNELPSLPLNISNLPIIIKELRSDLPLPVEDGIYFAYDSSLVSINETLEKAVTNLIWHHNNRFAGLTRGLLGPLAVKTIPLITKDKVTRMGYNPITFFVGKGAIIWDQNVVVANRIWRPTTQFKDRNRQHYYECLGFPKHEELS